MFTIDGFEVRWVRSKIPVIILGILLIALAVPFLLPSSVYQSFIEKKLEENTGLEFSFDSSFHISLLPKIHVDARDIMFNGEVAKGVQIVGSLEKFSVDMEFWPLLGGDLHVDDFQVIAPRVTVDGDFTPMIPDWFRAQLSASRKKDIRYSEVIQHFFEDSVFKVTKITEGHFLWKRNNQQTIDVERIALDIYKPANGQEFTIEGNAYVNNRTVDLNLNLERPDEFLRGYRSALTLQIDSAPLLIEFNGSAAKRQTFVSQGAIRLEVPSVFDFCMWLSAQDSCKQKDGNILLLSDIKLRDQRLQIEQASYVQDPFSAKVEGIIDFKLSKPEVIGTVTLPTRDLDHYLPSVQGFSNLNFNDLFLEAYSANVDVVYQGIRLSAEEILTPRFKVRVEGGRLSISTQQLNLFDGLSSGRIRWHKGLEGGYMDARFDLNGMDLKRLQKTVGQDMFMQGALDLSLELQAEGATIPALLETSTIRGDIAILDGSILNPQAATALSGGEVSRFDFTEVKGRLQGNRGELISENIRFVAPSVDVSGKLSFDFIDQKLDLTLNSNSDTEQAARNGYVRLSGPVENIVLSTSLGKAPPKQTKDDLLSGLLPYEEENKEPTFGEREITIEENDLLD